MGSDRASWARIEPSWHNVEVVISGVLREASPFTAGSYHASLVHDALYQYLDSVPISKREIDRLFLKMLGDFRLRRIYYVAVRMFGGRRVKQEGLRRVRERNQ